MKMTMPWQFHLRKLIFSSLTPSLKALTLSHNTLLEITADVFLGLSILEFVDMSHNHIGHVENATFKVSVLNHDKIFYFKALIFPVYMYTVESYITCKLQWTKSAGYHTHAHT